MSKKRGFLLLTGLVLALAAAQAAASATDSLEDAVQAVKGMIAQGRPRAEIAAWVTKTVDGRITSMNRNEADERGGMHASAYDVARESFDAWSEEGVGVDDPYASAHWTWENRVGHCQENAHMAYHMLMMAGESGAELGELACGDHILGISGTVLAFLHELKLHSTTQINFPVVFIVGKYLFESMPPVYAIMERFGKSQPYSPLGFIPLC